MAGSAATHGREKGNFVAGVERCVPRGKFLIAGSDDGRTIFGEFGVAGGVDSEDLLDSGGCGAVGGVLGPGGEVFETAEEKDGDADGLGDGWHKGIVARRGGFGEAADSVVSAKKKDLKNK